jgi:chromosome segregation and condensation protein ScpB
VTAEGTVLVANGVALSREDIREIITNFNTSLCKLTTQQKALQNNVEQMSIVLVQKGETLRTFV